MPRINPASIDQIDNSTQATLESVKSKLGMVPNLFATLAHSSVALNGYISLAEIVTKGKLNARQRELIALAVAQINECQYCLSAHTLLGKGAGLSESEMMDARVGVSINTTDQAISALARKVVAQKAILSDAELNSARSAGLKDDLILEVVSNVILNLMSNYVNHIAQTAIDFPLVSVTQQHAA